MSLMFFFVSVFVCKQTSLLLVSVIAVVVMQRSQNISATQLHNATTRVISVKILLQSKDVQQKLKLA